MPYVYSPIPHGKKTLSLSSSRKYKISKFSQKSPIRKSTKMQKKKAVQKSYVCNFSPFSKFKDSKHLHRLLNETMWPDVLFIDTSDLSDAHNVMFQEFIPP